MKEVVITKTGGRVSMNVDLDGLLSTLRNGVYTMTIKRKSEKRSIAQNDLMWMWFTCIQDATGTPKEDVKLYYQSKFLRKWVSLAGEVPTMVVLETSKLTTEQFTKFLNNIQADAASELGITLPTPDDLHWQAFFETYK